MRVAALTLAFWVTLVFASASAMHVWGDASLFVPRSHCGNWGEWAIVYQAANAVIAVAYMLIPLELGRRFPEAPAIDRFTALSFIVFILLCGGGHLLDGVVMFYWPNYRVATIWHVCTAIASVVTALTLPLAVHRMWSTQLLDKRLTEK